MYCVISEKKILMGYNPDRLYTMWLYGGVGLLACDKFPEGKTKGGNYRYLIHWNSGLELGVHAGIMNNFRISNRLDFHIDLQTVITSWHFDSDTRDYWTEWHRAHYDLTAMAGLMYYIGGRRFDVVEKPEITETDCSAQERRIEELVQDIFNVFVCLAEYRSQGPLYGPFAVFADRYYAGLYIIHRSLPLILLPKRAPSVSAAGSLYL